MLHSVQHRQRLLNLRASLVLKCEENFREHPGTYNAYGETHYVPRKASKSIVVSPCQYSEHVSKLLSVSFAAHGTLELYQSSNPHISPNLSLSKACSKSEILHIFLRYMGGSIARRASQYNLLCQPLCVWRVHGQSALDVARNLSLHSTPMQGKLAFLARLGSWPVTREERLQAQLTLAAIPWQQSNHFEIESLMDLGVMFDVSGSLRLREGRCDRLGLYISCFSKAEFDQMYSLIQAQLGSKASPGFQAVSQTTFGRGRSCGLLRLTNDRAVRDLLFLLRGNLFFKEEEVRQALNCFPKETATNLKVWYGKKNLELRQVPRIIPEYHELVRKRKNLYRGKGSSHCDDNTLYLAAKVSEELEIFRLRAQIQHMQSLLTEYDRNLNRVSTLKLKD